jgi:hypothetical protein
MIDLGTSFQLRSTRSIVNPYAGVVIRWAPVRVHEGATRDVPFEPNYISLTLNFFLTIVCD